MEANYLKPFSEKRSVQNAIARKRNNNSIRERKETYISCWHANKIENMAMWKVHGKDNKAIAIKTTIAKLRSILPHCFEIYEVRYVDNGESAFRENGELLNSFMIKRKEFFFENEVRAVTIEEALKIKKNMDKIERQGNNGISIKLDDITNLVEMIYISPKAGDSFFLLVKKILGRYNLENRIKRSKLDIPPYQWSSNHIK